MTLYGSLLFSSRTTLRQRKERIIIVIEPKISTNQIGKKGRVITGHSSDFPVLLFLNGSLLKGALNRNTKIKAPARKTDDQVLHNKTMFQGCCCHYRHLAEYAMNQFAVPELRQAGHLKGEPKMHLYSIGSKRTPNIV